MSRFEKGLLYCINIYAGTALLAFAVLLVRESLAGFDGIRSLGESAGLALIWPWLLYQVLRGKV